MTTPAYYNEFDPQAAQWLRNLIAAGLIPAGDVDERSIEDVTPNDLRGYVQCHFFAGIGGWPLALALAGWPSGRSVWTGSCPCQPFSAAGKGAGFADGRHLWPTWQHLIAQCRPPVIFGEQVASKAVDPWIDLVHADMEGMGYAFAGVAFPAAGVGAPHIRDRTYWVADADHSRLEGWGVLPERADQRLAGAHGLAGGVGHAASAACEWNAGSVSRSQAQVSGARCIDGDFDVRSEHAGSGVLRLANPEQCGNRCQAAAADHQRAQADGPADKRGGYSGASVQRPGPTNGQWADADWLGCTDGKWRPVEPGSQPLAHGIPGRVVRLRAYGNAIVPAQAAQFIAAYAEARGLSLDSTQQQVAA